MLRYRQLTPPLYLLVALSLSATASELPPDFVKLKDLAPDIIQNIKYYGADNFTGKPVPGYSVGECWLHKKAAIGLVNAQNEAKKSGLNLILYDCYRPMRAVRSFVSWAHDDNIKTKSIYYPHENKKNLILKGYISDHSMHSTGNAVDLAIVGLDFGTSFDYFDKKSWTENAENYIVKKNRQLLKNIMEKNNFENIPQEWWHYTYKVDNESQRYDYEIK